MIPDLLREYSYPTDPIHTILTLIHPNLCFPPRTGTAEYIAPEVAVRSP